MSFITMVLIKAQKKREQYSFEAYVPAHLFSNKNFH